MVEMFSIVTILLSFVDIGVTYRSFSQKNLLGRVLGYSCIFAFLVNISYVLSVFLPDYFTSSFFSSIYFCSIDLALFFLTIYARIYTDTPINGKTKFIFWSSLIYMVFDICVLMINPFHEIAIHYILADGTEIARYEYQMMPLYQMHLLFSYLLVGIVLMHLIQKVLHVPQTYRKQYLTTIIGILVIVLSNGVFLYFPSIMGTQNLDYSIWIYSFAAFFLYWNAFEYPRRGMLHQYQTWVFQNISQGIVLFDFENKLLLKNERIVEMLPEISWSERFHINEFARQANIKIGNIKEKESLSFQFYRKPKDQMIPVRCDYRALRGKNNEALGCMLVFTDAALEMDILTGFHNWENFKRFVMDVPQSFIYPTAVGICDINGLTSINNTMGRNVGDQAIVNLANLLQEHFPADSYYVREHEASLVVFCYQMSEEEMRRRLADVRAAFNHITHLGCFLDMESAVGLIDQDNTDVLEAVRMIRKAVRTKKLMDKSSVHSELVTSLIRTLQECDDDTEAHVKRTQKMGEVLGRRIGLSDVQRSELALLCILHDIGKIGIPLEILNKPGKLNEPEWGMMRSHVEKGYQIALSSQELRGVADMILHHHERWDGKGYPTGLSKESIPLLSRIISVIDAYDAMVNDRVYRPAMTIEEAGEELKRCAGTQFDPSIVSEFLRMIGEEGNQFVRIADENREAELERLPAFDIPASEENDAEEVYRSGYIHVVEYSQYILGEYSQILSVDDKFEKITGYTKEDIAAGKMNQMDLIPSNERTEYLTMVNEQMARSDNAYFEHRLLRKDGTIIYVFCYGKQYYDSASRANRTAIIITNCATTHALRTMLDEEHSKAQYRLERWESKYRCDSLTGLLNHEAFKSDVELKLLSGFTKVMLLMIDVDYFKEYNDTYGHRAGDEYLILIAQTLTGMLRSKDLACRMGGDEFAAALFYDESIGDEIMLGRAKQICEKMNMKLTMEKKGTSLSVGVAFSGDGNENFNQLYEAADAALYESKNTGRAKISVSEKKTV